MNDKNDNTHKRNNNFQIDSQYINGLINELHELSIETDPLGGLETEERKDFKAFTALKIIRLICKTTAQWAIDHQVGMAHEGLSFVPNQPNQTKQHPDYIEQLSEANSHRHELLGAKLRNIKNLSTRDYSGEFLRNIIKNILLPNTLFLPDSIHWTYMEAFKAVDVNSEHPLFNYNATGHSKGKHKKLILQLKALRHIEFRKQLNEDTVINIQEEVAAAYDISSDYIRKFNKYLREELGNIAVDREIAFTQNAANNFLYYKNIEPDGTMKTNMFKERLSIFSSSYNTESLEQDGLKYQNLKLSGKHKH